MRIDVTAFVGANKALHPKLLGPGQGVESLNQKPGRGDLRPWKEPLLAATIPFSPVRNTIYRMGRDVSTPATYWLSWTQVVSVMRGFVADDTTERTYYTGNGTPKWTDNTMALAAEPYPTAFRELGVPAPDAVFFPFQTTPGTGTVEETRFYVDTFVTDKGEESAPGPISPTNGIAVLPGALLKIEGLVPPPAGAYGINRRRIYRTQVGNASTEFFFLREIAVGLAETTDDARKLGEVLPTGTFLMPPTNGKGLIALWNGIASMLVGKSVRYCEPYSPYAWPIEYELILNDTCVAQAAYGQTQVVLTTGKPYVIGGQDPAQMSEQQLEIDQACVSATSVVSVGHGVCWASPDGLTYFGQLGAHVLTEGLLKREDWQAMVPSTVIGSRYEGMYFGCYTQNGARKGFIIDSANPTGLYFLALGYRALFRDTVNDSLFVLDTNGEIKQWDAGEALMNATFRSKVFRLEAPASMSCCQVVSDFYPVTVKIWADDILRMTKTVDDGEPWRVTAGYLADNWQVEIQSSNLGGVQGLALADSMSELA